MKVFAAFVVALTALYFLISSGPLSLKSLSAYTSDRFSEIASSYATDEVKRRLNSETENSDERVELISIKLDHGFEHLLYYNYQQSQIEISYRIGDEIFEFETLHPSRSTGDSIIWVDMTVPEDIRIFNPEYSADDQRRLRQYASDVKNIIDISIDLIGFHIEDQTSWREVFTSDNS